MSERFFPFDPRGTRQSFVLGALACAALTAWAAVGALGQADRLAAVRAVASAAVMVAFGYGWYRLRPRSGWGVTVSTSGLTLARPLAGEPLRVDWRYVKGARRERTGGGKLLLVLRQGEEVPIGAQMFPSRKAFNDVVDAVGEHLQPTRYDA